MTVYCELASSIYLYMVWCVYIWAEAKWYGWVCIAPQCYSVCLEAAGVGLLADPEACVRACVCVLKAQWRQPAAGQMKVWIALLPPMCHGVAGAPVTRAIVVSHRELHCHICLKCEKGCWGGVLGGSKRQTDGRRVSRGCLITPSNLFPLCCFVIVRECKRKLRMPLHSICTTENHKWF